MTEQSVQEEQARRSAAPETRADARRLPHPTRLEIRLEGVLQALADPVRLQVVRELAADTEELPCSFFDLPVSKSTTTYHFRVLRESGVIRQTYQGTAKLNALREEDLEALFPGLLGCVLAADKRQGRTDDA
ncbi:ArsR/SmtB family transcription factor [Streptomyces sp. NPDC054784]